MADTPRGTKIKFKNKEGVVKTGFDRKLVRDMMAKRGFDPVK